MIWMNPDMSDVYATPIPSKFPPSPIVIDLADIHRAARQTIGRYSPADVMALAQGMYASEMIQVRMLAALLCGELAADLPEAHNFLRQIVSRDPDWRVQEALAKAFDITCGRLGYREALPDIAAWLADPRSAVRRAACEGLRVWTDRPYFRDHPQEAIHLLSPMGEDDSGLVRRSAALALNEVLARNPALMGNR